MKTVTVRIPLELETARIYTEATAETQKKLRLLLGLWLREFAISPRSLQSIMDEISQKAQERGLTPEILDALLHAD
jgi:hypothetical protein